MWWCGICSRADVGAWFSKFFFFAAPQVDDFLTKCYMRLTESIFCTCRLGTENAFPVMTAEGHWTRFWLAMALTRIFIVKAAMEESLDPRDTVTATHLHLSLLVNSVPPCKRSHLHFDILYDAVI